MSAKKVAVCPNRTDGSIVNMKKIFLNCWSVLKNPLIILVLDMAVVQGTKVKYWMLFCDMEAFVFNIVLIHIYFIQK